MITDHNAQRKDEASAYAASIAILTAQYLSDVKEGRISHAAVVNILMDRHERQMDGVSKGLSADIEGLAHMIEEAMERLRQAGKI